MKKDQPYLDSLTDYQDNISSPGAYSGGKLHPATLSKNKAGGWVMIIVGVFLLGFYSFGLFYKFSFENLGLLFFIGVAVLLIIAGVRVLKQATS